MRPVMDSYEASAFVSFDHACPRCGAETSMRFMSPCATCMAALRDLMEREASVVDAEYSPKMNVTPNAVASKDD